LLKYDNIFVDRGFFFVKIPNTIFSRLSALRLTDIADHLVCAGYYSE